MDSMAEPVSEGWDRLRQTASFALTRFLPEERTALPAREEIDDGRFRPVAGWSMPGGDVFENERRAVVGTEVPVLSNDDFDVQVLGQTLVVRGEKRFERETSQGRRRLLPCACGSFERRLALSTAVRGDEASAQYRDGVLHIELPETVPAAHAVGERVHRLTEADSAPARNVATVLANFVRTFLPLPNLSRATPPANERIVSAFFVTGTTRRRPRGHQRRPAASSFRPREHSRDAAFASGARLRIQVAEAAVIAHKARAQHFCSCDPSDNRSGSTTVPFGSTRDWPVI